MDKMVGISKRLLDNPKYHDEVIQVTSDGHVLTMQEAHTIVMKLNLHGCREIENTTIPLIKNAGLRQELSIDEIENLKSICKSCEDVETCRKCSTCGGKRVLVWPRFQDEKCPKGKWISGNSEVNKYKSIYNDSKKSEKYGHSNHGGESLPIIIGWNPSSVLDIGCGHNEFVKQLREKLPASSIIGGDFACPSADIKLDITERTCFRDKSFDVVTAFDVLEHLTFEQLPSALSEMSRISKRFCFSIGYLDSVWKVNGETLHPIVKPYYWWHYQITKAGGRCEKSSTKFIYGTWEGHSLFPMDASKSCVVVGNGPSLLSKKIGPIIDLHDEVVRFNSYKCTGFEKHTGCKTTMWSRCHPSVVKQEKDSIEKMITPYPQEIKLEFSPKYTYQIPLEHYRLWEKKAKEGTSWPVDKISNLKASTGLMTIAWLLENVYDKIHIAGFDGFVKVKNKQHHYWDPKHYGRPKEHDGDWERIVIDEYKKQGRIIDLMELV